MMGVCAGGPLLDSSAEEDRLPRVRVACPLVENQSAEVFVEIHHAAEQRVGNEVIDRGPAGVAGVAGTEVPSLGNRNPSGPELNEDLRVTLQEFRRDLDEGRLGLR